MRQLLESDLPRIKELYARFDFDYTFPNLKEFFPIPVIVDENDQVIMAIGALPTVELFLFLDPEWETPGMRMEAFKFLHEFIRLDMLSRKIVEGNVFLPPQFEKNFGRRLMKQFGWRKSKGWPCFSRRTE